jgi:hypothetical protein
MSIIGPALAVAATALAFAYMWRMARLHIKTQPALFVLTQAAAGGHALLVWLSATEGTWTAADVAGVIFSALYLWRSRKRMGEYIDGEVSAGRPMDAVPDTVIIRRSPAESHPAEDRRAA